MLADLCRLYPVSDRLFPVASRRRGAVKLLAACYGQAADGKACVRRVGDWAGSGMLPKARRRWGLAHDGSAAAEARLSRRGRVAGGLVRWPAAWCEAEERRGPSGARRWWRSLGSGSALAAS
jgi:hypothetical protein